MDNVARRTQPPQGGRRRVIRTLRRSVLRPQLLAFLPAIVLGGVWFGGQGVLLVVAMTVPLLLVLGGLADRAPVEVDGLTGLLTGEALAEEVDAALLEAKTDAESAIVIALEIDHEDDLAARLGPAAMDNVLCHCADRIVGAIRGRDRVARIGEARFAVLLAPVRNAGLDVALKAVERIQTAVAAPIGVDAAAVYVSISAGFCLERRAPARTGAAMLDAATIALGAARAVGGGAVRAYAREMRGRGRARPSMGEDLARALEDGHVRPWFQPQVHARSGALSGVEALARWEDPRRGLVAPSDFLPVADAAGLMERLGEVILQEALSALRRWDGAGLAVPCVGVNFSQAELSNPRLAERVAWDLDRFDLQAGRLTVEILETVAADASRDAVTANISALAGLGCRIDLDDFGTGSASIANIRRFGVGRIKIDRSFVTRADCDPQQRQMLAAILSLAQQLDLETLAEGVETTGEQRLLCDLGCDHIQGFALARPMPFEDAGAWIRAHAARTAAPDAAERRVTG